MKHAPVIKLLAGAIIALCVTSSPVMARDSNSGKDKKESLYPNATRTEPKLDLTSEKDQKALNEGLDAVNNQDKDKAQQILQPIVDSSKSKYAQALALQGLANVHYNEGDIKGAIELLKRALDNGVMPNDTFFQLQYMLAQFYAASEQYQLSLDTITKWRADGKRETADSYGLEGTDYYRLEKYPEAITAIKKAQSLAATDKDAQNNSKQSDNWNQILLASYAESGQSDQAAQIAQQQVAANPNDPTAMANAVAALTQAHKYPDAIALLEKQRAAGNLKDEKSYINLAKLYLVSGQEGDDPKGNATKAEAVLKDGMSKGVIQPSYESYKLLGDAGYISDDTASALDAYRKAIPMASDGEAAMTAGTLLLNEGKYTEAKSLIQQAIDKGVKKPGNAYMALADADRNLKDKAGAVAAVKKAATYPDAADKAQAWLKKQQAGAGK